MAQLQEQIDLLQIGQTVIVETKKELLEGVLEHVSKRWPIIELSNVCDLMVNYVYTSNQLLNCNQIISIKVLTSDNYVNDSTPSTSTIAITENASENCIPLNKAQLDLIKKKLDRKTYIIQMDHKYHKALDDIKMQSVVSLCMEPIDIGRHCRTSVIAIATTTNVYIFDMFFLGKIFNDLRQIFTSQRPRKVVHVSHKYVDNLYHRHKIEMKGIFDTFVAYCLIRGVKEPKSLEETVEETLRVPAKYFQMADTPPLTFNFRPLAKESLIHIAKKTIMQLQLYEYLLHAKMLHRFYEQCENLSDTIVGNEDDFVAAQQ